MISPDFLGALALLAERAFSGRVLLSLLPPGLPGRHGPRELPATWAASHVLGSAALLIEARVLESIGILERPGILLAPWLLLALARWITLPGAMVPRHEPFSEPPAPPARILGTAAVLLPLAGSVYAAIPAASARAVLLPLADSSALLALVAFALSAGRREPTGRAWAQLGLAVILALALATSHADQLPLALSLGAGAALGVPWLRRGDRRAAAIAVVAFAACALYGPREALLGAGGLFALWLHTPASERPAVALFSAILLPVCAWLALARPGGEAPPGPILSPLAAATLVVVAFALTMRQRLVAARDREPEPRSAGEDRVDSPRPQAVALRDTVLLCAVTLASRGDLASTQALVRSALPLAPLLTIEAALLLVRPESPLAARTSVRPDAPGVRR